MLCGFDKTRTLQPGESQTLSFEIPLESVASYDDSGVTGHKSAWILEQGGYVFYAGADVRMRFLEAYQPTLPETVVRQCKSALGRLPRSNAW